MVAVVFLRAARRVLKYRSVHSRDECNCIFRLFQRNVDVLIVGYCLGASVVVGASVMTLGASYALYRSGRLGFDSGIVFAPFDVSGRYSSSDAVMLWRKLAASVVFPLVVVAMWPRASWRSASMRLAWDTFAIGLFFFYFVAESGPRLPDGNFVWSGQMAAFALFVASAAFVRAQLERGSLAAQRRVRSPWRSCWRLHVESGIRHVQVKVEPFEVGALVVVVVKYQWYFGIRRRELSQCLYVLSCWS